MEVRFSLRIPKELHAKSEDQVRHQKAADPGASLNSWILVAIREKLQRDAAALEPALKG